MCPESSDISMSEEGHVDGCNMAAKAGWTFDARCFPLLFPYISIFPQFSLSLQRQNTKTKKLKQQKKKF